MGNEERRNGGVRGRPRANYRIYLGSAGLDGWTALFVLATATVLCVPIVCIAMARRRDRVET